jgi:hypothetical protein
MQRRIIAGLIAASTLVGACSGDGTAEPAIDTTGTTTAAATTTATPVTAADTTVATTPPTDAPSTSAAPTTTIEPIDLTPFTWSTVTEAAPWARRAGLRVAELGDSLFMVGGRTPNQSTLPGDSTVWGDVWRSDDGGATWVEVLPSGTDGGFPARAYFALVVKDDALWVLGGQDFGLEENPFCALLEQGLEPPPGLGIDPDAPCPEFLPTSQFFNDVWTSTDGVTWEQVTANAPWDGRAGLSAAVLGDEIYVLGGSQNDDSAIIGAGGPQRIYYRDVWKSSDGVTWELATEAAPWEPRAGAAVAVKGEALYMLGGEDGFTCTPLPDCEPPYFNDVWRTTDGATWEEVTDAAGWSPRPGHVCKVLGGRFVCFGGFGLIQNPTDMWSSPDGEVWSQLPQVPWNAADPTAIRYDFDALVTTDESGDEVLLTFGGDRETFDFTDPENWTRVDNDVWAFGP